MICTSSYPEFKNTPFKTHSISWDRGKDAEYHGKCYPNLAPHKSFWRTWKDNLGKIPDEENNMYYIKEYWKQVLSKLDVEEVYKTLNNSTLLCYETNTQFCHRHIVAAWFELLLGAKVPEVNNMFNEVERPEYIKEYLEDAMRLNRNMHGFTSLRALYLFEKGEKLEARADELEEQTGKCYDNYRQEACFYKCEADAEEIKYRKSQRQKNLSKTKPKEQ